MTIKSKPVVARLEYMRLSFCYACCTKVNSWLVWFYFFCKSISDAAGGELKTFIVLYVLFPLFGLCNYSFKLLHTFREDRNFLLTGVRNREGLNELCINLGYCSDQFVVIGKGLVGSYPIADYIEALKCRIYFLIHGISIKDIDKSNAPVQPPAQEGLEK